MFAEEGRRKAERKAKFEWETVDASWQKHGITTCKKNIKIIISVMYAISKDLHDYHKIAVERCLLLKNYE